MAIDAPKVSATIAQLNNGGDGKIEEAVQGVSHSLIDIIQASAAGLATIMIIIGAYLMMFAMGESDRFDKGRDLILVSIAGLIFITFATELSTIINPSATTLAGVINLNAFAGFVNGITLLLEGFVSVIVVTATIAAGFKYITAGEDDGRASDATKAIGAAAMGMFFIGISRLLVTQVFFPNNTLNTNLAGSIETVIKQIINVALEFSGLLAVAILIYAGFSILISGGERGKATAIHAVSALFIMLFAYGFVQLIFVMLT